MTNLKNACLHSIDQLRWLISALDTRQYATSLQVFQGASIGKHIRHIIEFYQAVMNAGDKLNYDDRVRNPEIEQKPEAAVLILNEIVEFINSLKEDKPLNLVANFGLAADEDEIIPSSLHRELAYNLEHCIHHMALIRIGVEYLRPEFDFPADFGVASSTLRNKEEILKAKAS